MIIFNKLITRIKQSLKVCIQHKHFHVSHFLSDESIVDSSLNSAKFITNSIDDIKQSAFRIEPFGHKVLVLQPYIKFGWKKKTITNTDLQVEESVTLVNSIRNWKVAACEKVPLLSFDKGTFFGTGKLDEIAEIIKSCPEKITAIFVSINMLKPSQHSFLENEYQLPVYDRYLIVMQIFREHAISAEAKLQISMAEIPYLWSRVSYANSSNPHPGVTSSAIQGCGVSANAFHETRKLHLRNYEKKIKSSLEKLNLHREHSRHRRKENNFPIVAVIGYTNAGKTSLIKALTGSEKLEPKNYLFATLDVTFHEGVLPSNLKVLYVDTIGFISDIPTRLIEPFKVTLRDAIVADIIIHVEDISHPDILAQRDQVNNTLKQLRIEHDLVNNMITVSNKIDLLHPDDDIEVPDGSIQVSCANLTGIQELKEVLEKKIIKSTNRMKMVIRSKTGGREMEWLHKEAAVTNISTDPNNNNYSLIKVIITESCLNRFKHTFIH